MSEKLMTRLEKELDNVRFLYKDIIDVNSDFDFSNILRRVADDLIREYGSEEVLYDGLLRDALKTNGRRYAIREVFEAAENDYVAEYGEAPAWVEPEDVLEWEHDLYYQVEDLRYYGQMRCLKTYVEDGIEYWTRSRLYEFDTTDFQSFNIKTNGGKTGSAGYGYTLDELQMADYFRVIPGIGTVMSEAEHELKQRRSGR